MRIVLRLCFVTLLLLVSAALARAQVFTGVDADDLHRDAAAPELVLGPRRPRAPALGAHRRGLRPAALRRVLAQQHDGSRPRHITSTRKDATLGADARYSFQREGWRPYVGAGFGLHFLSTEVDAPALGLKHADDSVIKGGLSGLAGVTFPLTKHLDNFMELKYHHLPGFSQLKLNMGVAWRP